MSTVYNRGKARIANVGWPNLDVRVLILTDADTVPAEAENPDLNFVADLLAVAGVTEAAETTGLTGYIRQALATEAVNEDDVGDVANLDADNLAYDATESGRWVAGVLYEEAVDDASRNLISLHTLPAALVTNGGPVAININAAGLFGVA